jgi:hypothetical protein
MDITQLQVNMLAQFTLNEDTLSGRIIGVDTSANTVQIKTARQVFTIKADAVVTIVSTVTLEQKLKAMTKEELIAEIYRIDPEFSKIDIDLTQYSIEALQKTIIKKKTTPVNRTTHSSQGWYSNFKPSSRQVTPHERTDGYEIVESSTSRKKEEAKSGVALSGFDALRKE